MNMSDKNRKRLVVIDGKSVFYRGYYAMPYLSTKDGTPTGGVYGFAVMALEVLKKMEPDYVCVAWDKAKTSINRRREIYPEYKANRKPAPADFYEQIPLLHQLLEAFGIPIYEIDDHEADDIMATFATQASTKGYETILVSSDHDLLQLINDDVVVATLKKGLTHIDYFDPKRFKERYKMTPTQFVDYKSLRGDPSDNLPGVAGVGEKTAIKLIEDYGSLDEIYSNLDQIKGGLNKKLVGGKEAAYMTRKLVMLDRNIDLNLDWEQADVGNSDGGAAIAKILNDLEFKTLLNQLPDAMKQSVEELKRTNNFSVKTKIISVNSPEDLEKIDNNSDRVVVATHNSGAAGSGLTTVLLSTSNDSVYVINLERINASEVAAKIQTLITRAEVMAYDAKAVVKSFIRAGFGEPRVAHDVHMAAFLLDSASRDRSLTALAANYLEYHGESIDNLSPEDLILKADTVVSVIWALIDEQNKQLEELVEIKKLAHEVEWPLINVLAKMEIEGVGLDVSFLAEMSERLSDKIVDCEQEIYGYADQEFNISSPSQLADILFVNLGLSSAGIKKGKTGYSTAASELDKLRGQHPIIDLITTYRELTKLKNTYVDPLPTMVDEHSRLHTTFSTWVAPTGRLSSHDPNLQNIPARSELGREIRRAFVAKDGHVFVSADYSQFELRLAAVLANDIELIESFNDGLDIHTRTAAQVYGVPLEDVTKNQRRDAKVINFGILYGMSPHGLSVATGMNQKEAKEFIDRYFNLRKPLLDYIEKTKKQAEEQGFVETMFGRRRPTPDVKSSNYVVREAAFRAAFNHPIQGTEADLMKMAMIKIDQQLDADSKQILQVHDSILVECPEDKADSVANMMKQTMEGVYHLPVNLDVDVSIGQNWGEL